MTLIRLPVLASVSAALLSAGLISGCANPPPKVTPHEAVLIEAHQTLDLIHNREASMEFYSENRGGAAVRKDEAAHVLFNEHYEADARQATVHKIASEPSKAASEAAQKTQAIGTHTPAAQKRSKANSKDKSIYSKKAPKLNVSVRDKSVYSKPGKKAKPVLPSTSGKTAEPSASASELKAAPVPTPVAAPAASPDSGSNSGNQDAKPAL